MCAEKVHAAVERALNSAMATQQHAKHTQNHLQNAQPPKVLQRQLKLLEHPGAGHKVGRRPLLPLLHLLAHVLHPPLAAHF